MEPVIHLKAHLLQLGPKYVALHTNIGLFAEAPTLQEAAAKLASLVQLFHNPKPEKMP